MTRRLFAVALLTAAVVAGTTTSASAADRAAVATASFDDFADKLRQLPAAMLEGLASPVISYVDMTLVWHRAGVGADVAERVEALPAMSEPVTFGQGVELFGSSTEVDEQRTEVGFSFAEIDREIAIVAPPRRAIVVDTTVSTDAVVGAIESDPLWSSDLEEVVDADSGPYWSWGDDQSVDLARRSPMRPLGQAGQLALLNRDPATVIRTIDGHDMAATQLAISGDEPTLVDSPFGIAASALEGEAVVQAIGTINTPPPDAVRPPTGVFIFDTIDEGRPVTQIVFTYAKGADAVTNGRDVVTPYFYSGVEPATRRRVKDLLPDPTIEQIGSAMVVTIVGSEYYPVAVQLMMTASLPLG